MTPAAASDWVSEALREAEAQPGPTITITKALYAWLNERAFPPHAAPPDAPSLRAALEHIEALLDPNLSGLTERSQDHERAVRDAATRFLIAHKEGPVGELRRFAEAHGLTVSAAPAAAPAAAPEQPPDPWPAPRKIGSDIQRSPLVNPDFAPPATGGLDVPDYKHPKSCSRWRWSDGSTGQPICDCGIAESGSAADLYQFDLARIMEAVGLEPFARSQSPHMVVHDVLLPAIRERGLDVETLARAWEKVANAHNGDGTLSDEPCGWCRDRAAQTVDVLAAYAAEREGAG